MKVNLILPDPSDPGREKELLRVAELLLPIPSGIVFQGLPGDGKESLRGALATADLTLVCCSLETEGKRLAAIAGVPVYTDVEQLEVTNGELYAVRPVFSGHLKGAFPAKGAVLIVSRGLSGEAGGQKAEQLLAVLQESGFSAPAILKKEAAYTVTERKEAPVSQNLGEAKILFLGGSGLGSTENYRRMKEAAQKFGASAGCTRLAALKGWADYSEVVGISGWSLKADLCIAFGVSGAGPLLAGLKEVKKVVAVNNDKDAPIFRFAHYGIVEDCVQILKTIERG